MAEYTNPAHTSGATLTTGELVNSTIAAIEKTGEDAYARDLTLKDGATATDLTVTAGAYLKVSANAVVDGVTLTNGGATPTIRVSNGGVVKNVVTNGTVSLYPYGGTVENVTANASCYLNVFYNGVVDGGTFSGKRLQVGSKAGQPGGTIRNIVIKTTTVPDGAHQVQETGSMYDCTISKGARYQVSGGLAVRTIVSGAGARLYISKGTANSTMVYSGGSGCVLGGTVNDTVVFSGGSLFVSGGTVNGTVLSGNSAKLYVSQGTVNDTLVSSGGKMYVYYNETAPATLGTVTLRGKGGESGTADVVFCRIMGGTIDKIVASGGYLHIASGAVVGNLSAYATEATKIFLSSGGVVNGGYTSGSFELRMESGGGTVKNLTVGPQTYLFWSAGYASGVTIASNAGQFRFYGSSRDALLVEDATIYGSAIADQYNRGLVEGVMSNCRIMSGGFMRQAGGLNKDMTVAGTLHISGGETSDVTVSGYNAHIIASGGTIDGALIEDYGKFTVREGATLLDPVVHMNFPTAIKVGNNWQYARLNVGSTGIKGGYVSGGTAGAFTSGVFGNTLEIYAWSGGVIEDMTYNMGAYVGAYSGATISGGTFNNATLSLRGGRAEKIVLTSGASVIYSGAAGGTLDGATVHSGARVAVSSGAFVSNVELLSGGSLYVYGNGAKAVGISADEGAYVRLNFSAADPGRTEAYFDTLENINATIELLNVGTATKTFDIADVGDTNQRFAMVGSGIFEGTFKAGDVYVDPFTQQQLTVAADATTIDVVQYTRTTINEVATFAQSGSVINGGDKELMWEGATVTGAVKLIDTGAAAAITGDAWMDIRACSAGEKAAIYGTDVDVNFDGKVRYQFHGTGDTIGNLAAGANYGGSVKGVEMLTYNTTYTGVGYVGGFGTVENDVDVIFAGGNTLDKDFYAGALANYAKKAVATSVGDIRATIGEKADDSISVKGNFYGASAVKAGTITTTAATDPLHTVGNVELTLLAGTATKGTQACVFAGGYATGHDEAKLAPVYTVESVTLNVTGGDWGEACGGRGLFGGAFASDNIVDGDEAAGVWAQIGDVNLTVSGGTMGNVYGGGWAQKGARSEVGNVSITVTGGTMANIFGGGSTSASGGATVAGNVTITVSGGTINGDIYARGQNATDLTGAAGVIFTGDAAFTCGVYGYSYVGGAGEGAALSFSDYTGTFSGAIGGFDSVTLDGATAMTLGTAESAVKNTAWTFDAADRDARLTGTALLNWTAADFAGDTITLKLGTTATEWTLIDAASTTAYGTFDVDGVASGLSLDQKIENTGTVYDGWGFTLEESALKFKQLA